MPMSNQPVAEVFAENLRYWMRKKDLRQMGLAEKASVSQKTISNYLNPKQRLDTSTGKAPSPNLTELERVSNALQVPLWMLLLPMKSANDAQLAREFGLVVPIREGKG